MITAPPIARRDNLAQQRGMGMPIFMMALLALIVFGLIGILLTAAMILEHRKHAHATQGDVAHAITAGVSPSIKPKHA